jgi:ankyrin repeat protein
MSGRLFTPTLKNKTLKLTQSQKRKNERLLFHIKNENVLKVQSLLWRGADPNYKDNDGTYSTPLLMASYLASPEIVRVLLDGGADVNYRPLGDIKQTPLMVACASEHHLHALGVVRLLLDRGADVTAQTTIQSGWNALVFACEAGNRDIVHLLLERGGMGSGGGEGLMIAAEKGYTEIAQMLLGAGVDINYVNPRTQTTPLMRACMVGQLRSVEVLVRAGADVNIVDSNGVSAIQYARGYAQRYGRPEIVYYLEGPMGNRRRELPVRREGELPVRREGENPISIMAGPAVLGSLGANDPSRVEGSLGGPGPVEDEMGESDPSRVETPRTRKGGYYKRKTYKKGY